MPAPPTFLRTLCNLRWVAIIGQTISVLVAVHVMGLPLRQAPLWAGIAVLAAFNLFAGWQSRRLQGDRPGWAFAHMLVDVAVLAWLVGCSGGISNPFGSMFLLIIAVAALALPIGWVMATAAACLLGYGLSAAYGIPLPHAHGNGFNLHLWGMAVNFVLSAAVVLYFSTRLVAALRQRERELAMLRERFARNEGIVALATHAAAVAHELNTPLATMTLLVDDIAELSDSAQVRGDAITLRGLIDVCRDRVRGLASSADPGTEPAVDPQQVIDRWQLIRPTVQLQRAIALPSQLRVQPAVGHLLQALLNNAADASLESASRQVDVALAVEERWLLGEVRDYGAGFSESLPYQPDALFRSSKPDGMGVGLALSNATVERMGGHMQMQSAASGGTRVLFRLPLLAASGQLA
ncbi:ATP-binding protein [Pseudoxanthomonas dokdonensis]|uniref:histidine kinase n=1 Tax=Pseudoxanthomonas dokdonensis TaxID=344882 RepID=A0A0R0CMU0_9GAMM|nr:ATP-binding protein [Pseudoxanthomonas dokdonensis]KRG70891.1 histidine kinase [Pseudoxanthomonas dokdonensis]